MKKLTYLLSMFFLLLVCSCTNEMETEMKDGLFSFSSMNASMGDLPTSRTHLENDGRVVWDVNDQVGIFSDMQTEPVLFECMSVDDSKASFTGFGEVSGSNFYAYFPYSNSRVEENKLVYTLPEYFIYAEGSYLSKCPMIAQSSTNNFKFKHTCGILHFTITGKNKIGDVTLSGNNNEIIAGTGIVDLSKENPIFTIPHDATDASTTITMYVGGRETTSTETHLYFVIPQKEFAKGITLTIDYVDEYGCIQKIKKSTSKSILVSRSVVKSFSVVDTDELIQEEKDKIYNALMALYNATDGDNWTYNANWGTNKPFNEWDRISGDHKTVRVIDLWNNNLRGYIPQEITALQDVFHITLNENQIDSIHNCWNEMKNLESLSLDRCGIKCELPASLFQMPKIKNLHLYMNDFECELPKEIECLDLEHLWLQECKISGGIPKEFGKLKNLKELYLYGNQLTGNIPQELTQLPQLTILHLGWNNLSDELPIFIGDFPALEELHLYHNQLTGEIPAELGNIKTLKYLSLNDNLLTGTIPNEMSNLTNLEDLSLASNQLTGGIPNDFTKLQNLEMLWLNQNQLNGECSVEITDFIEQLDFYNIDQQAGYELILNFYKSTDFSKNGFVKLLQTHTKGNGINIVITMDAFSDRKIEDGTVDSFIDSAYKALFSKEPYITLKDYFDVYVVYTVSESEKIGKEIALGTTYSDGLYNLNYNKIETCVKNIEALKNGLTNTHILVLLNDKGYYRENCAHASYGSISCSNIVMEDVM